MNLQDAAKAAKYAEEAARLKEEARVKNTSPQNWYEQEFSPGGRDKLVDWNERSYIDGAGYLVDKSTGERAKDKWGGTPRMADPDLMRDYLDGKTKTSMDGRAYKVDPFTKERLYLDSEGNIAERALAGAEDIKETSSRRAKSGVKAPVGGGNYIESGGTRINVKGKTPPRPPRYMQNEFSDQNWPATYQRFRKHQVKNLFGGEDPDTTTWAEVAEKRGIDWGSDEYKRGKAMWDEKKGQLSSMMDQLNMRRELRKEADAKKRKVMKDDDKRKTDFRKQRKDMQKERIGLIEKLAEYDEYLDENGEYVSKVEMDEEFKPVEIPFTETKAMHVQALKDRIAEIDQAIETGRAPKRAAGGQNQASTFKGGTPKNQNDVKAMYRSGKIDRQTARRIMLEMQAQQEAGAR